MERLKQRAKRLLWLPPLIAALVALPTIAMAFVILATGKENQWYAGIVYALSAYGLAVLCVAIFNAIKVLKNDFWELQPIKWLMSTKHGSRFIKSKVFRTEVSLHQGLAMNVLYIAIKLVLGIYYGSVWLVSLAVYYTLLAIMRGILVDYVHRVPIGENMRLEYRRYRICGIMLLVMNQALAGIVFYVVHRNQGVLYPGLLIYVMAVYAFYFIITAIINVLKFRKIGSPVLSAAKLVNLTAALVSMLSLETAMLAEFGGDAVFRKYITAIFGGSICVFVLGMAIYMIVHSTKYLNNCD